MNNNSKGDKIFQLVINLLTLLIAVVTLYPLIYVVSASISAPTHILSGKVWLWPVDINFNAYRRVFTSGNILTGYRNTLLYAGCGTLLNVVLTIMAAYPLSIKDMKGRNAITFMITFTMFFSGGMIPSYINVKELGLLNTPFSVILPGAINATNMLILRNYFINSIPGELREAAEIDGASPLGTLMRIILPLSKAAIAVMVLFYGVARWNGWFNAMLYLRSRDKFPLQLILREILISNSTDSMESYGDSFSGVSESIKYATIIVATVPILVVYPFIQKYFVKGTMVGAVKG